MRWFKGRKAAGVAAAPPLSRPSLDPSAPDLLWAIDERVLREMVAMAEAARASGIAPATPDARLFAAEPKSAEDEKPYAMDGTTAVIPLIGALTKTRSWWSWYFGGDRLTLEEATAALIQAVTADEIVTDVRLYIDSPGGTCAGTVDLANAVSVLKKTKEINAYISDCCCSAAYWIASQCTKITANNDAALVGNIGTLLRVVDYSKMYAEVGMEVKLYRSSPLKGAGSPGAPITKAQDAEFQSIVDGIQAEFVAAVARGRGESPETVSAWADAHTYTAKEAKAAGLIDAIGPLEAVLVEESADPDDGGEDAPCGEGAAGNAAAPSPAAPPTPPPSEPPPPPPPSAAAPPCSVPSPATAAGNPRAPATTILPAPQKGNDMKDQLVRMLTALGLRRMAVAVVGVTSEEPQAIVSALAEQVNEEVQSKLDAHPLLMACTAAGITGVDDLKAVLKLRDFGIESLAELRTDAKVQAVRAFGQETGPTVAASLDSMSPAQVRTLRDAWRTQADAQYGIGNDGQAANRVSAPAARVALPAEGEPAEAKTAWEKLTPEQQKIALQVGGDTPEKREKIAARFLAGQEDK